MLINKVAVITGAKSGIGLAMAERFALEGARIILSDIRMANTETERIKNNGREVFFFQVDVSKAQDVESLFEEAINKYGRIDILVNNAGIELAKNIPETSIEEWDHLMSINLKGVFYVQRLQCRSGVIINMASELGLVGGI